MKVKAVSSKYHTPCLELVFDDSSLSTLHHLLSFGNRNQLRRLETKGLLRLRGRSKSISEIKSRVKFGDVVDIENPDIRSIFKKPCGCASILIVDDQYINRFIIHQYADKYNIPCDEAEDGEEAVAMAIEGGKRRC